MQRELTKVQHTNVPVEGLAYFSIRNLNTSVYYVYSFIYVLHISLLITSRIRRRRRRKKRRRRSKKRTEKSSC